MTRLKLIATTSLTVSARLWCVTALLGLWVFVYYIAAFYGGPTLSGNFEAWNANRFLEHGHVPGDTAGNLLFAAHVLLAALITFSGTLQLIPRLRIRAAAFHRWNGRFFLIAACTATLAGAYMSWIRGDVSLAINLNGALILVCAALAWRHAHRREFDAHRRWALRAFLVVNGVWFLRVGVMGWFIVNQALLGNEVSFEDPLVKFWKYGSYLVPLAVLELYFYAQTRGGAASRLAMSGMLLVLTAVMGGGIFGAFMFLWRPLL